MTDSFKMPMHDPDDRRVAELLLEVGRKQVSRREVLRRGVALGLSVPAIGWLLAACGGSSDNTKAPSTGATATGATTGGGGSASPTTGGSASPVTGGGTPKNGGRLTLILPSNVADLDPHSAYDSYASAVFFGTHEMLVRLKGDSTFDYQPMLATKWENNADFTEWTFTLADGAKFHDGTVCDGPAVVNRSSASSTWV